MLTVVVIIISYLIGSIPTGYLFTTRIKNIDVRDVGSGNVGATNAARALGMKYGVLVALLDVFKGFLAVSIAYLLQGEGMAYLPYLAGLIAILGHDHSVFLNFSGGKGVATTLGVILRTAPFLCLGIVLIWFFLSYVTRYVSVGSLTAAVLMPLGAYIFIDQGSAFIFFLLYGLLIIYKHRGNIQRLINGQENRIGGGAIQ